MHVLMDFSRRIHIFVCLLQAIFTKLMICTKKDAAVTYETIRPWLLRIKLFGDGWRNSLNDRNDY